MRLNLSARPRLEQLEERRLLAVSAGMPGPLTAMPAGDGGSAESSVLLVTADSDGAGDDEGLLSLREALVSARDGDRIQFDPSLSGKTITLSGNQLSVSASVVIDASNLEKGVTIDAGGASRVFSVEEGTEVSMVNLRICGGNTVSSGGGIYNAGTLTLTGCAVVDNSALRGGGIENGGMLTLVNCTLAGNSAETYGGGLNTLGGTVTVQNSVIVQNEAETAGDDITKEDGVTVTASYVLSSFAGWTESDHLVEYDAGRQVFSDAAGGIYTLAADSQAIDAGNNELAFSDRDLAGAARIQHLVIDLGAYEAGIGAAAHVSAWHAPYDAEEHIPEIEGLEEGDTVRYSTDGGMSFTSSPPVFVEMGAYPLTVQITRPHYETYTESGVFEVQEVPSSIVTSLEDLVDAVDGKITLREAILYTPAGGAVVFTESLSGKTISLSGEELKISDSLEIDASDLDGGLIIDANGGSRVFSVTGGTAARPIELIHLTLTGGMTEENGGGILSSGAALKLTDCTVAANTARYGGGLYAEGGTAVLTNCLFEKNSAVAGGGVQLQGSVMTVSDSRFLSNTALYYYGGGLENVSGTLTMSRSEVSKNTAGNGGGIDVDRGTLILDACVISGNSALRRLNTEDNSYYGGYGGGLYNYHGEISLSNSAVTDNEASNWGGGIETYGNMTLLSCTLAGNHADYGGGLDADAGAEGKVNLYNCIAAGNTAYSESNDISSSSGGIYAFYTLSSFEEWTGSESAYSFDGLIALFTDPEKGKYTLRRGTRCVDGGSNSYAIGSSDLAGNTRIVGGCVDLGAYEIQNSPMPLASPEILTGTGGISAAFGLGRQKIAWSPVDGASGYELSYTEDGIWWTSAVLAETSQVISGLRNGSLMQYKVRALGDGENYESSEWSSVKSFYVCPFDIDGDGLAGETDYASICAAWMSLSESENWDPRCDIDGDGFVGPGDYALFCANWMKESDFVFPMG